MSRWVIYPLLLLACVTAMLVSLTVTEAINRGGGRMVLQAGWILPTAVLSLAWLVFLHRRRATAPGHSTAQGSFSFVAAFLGFLIAGTLVFQLNQYSLGRTGRREAVVINKSMQREWGARRHPPAPPVCTVTVHSWRSPGRKVDGFIGCSDLGRIEAGQTKVPVVSELGLTRMEFIRVNAAH